MTKLTRIFFKHQEAEIPFFEKNNKLVVKEEEEGECWNELACLEFDEWTELETLCVNFAKKLSTFTHLENLQFILLLASLIPEEME